MIYFVRNYRHASSSIYAINRFYHLEDAYRSLLGDSLIRAAAFRILGISNDRIVFTVNSFGKPTLLGFDEFHFNISHSGCWVAVFLSDVPVGIDVEKIQSIAFFQRPQIEKKAFLIQFGFHQEIHILLFGKIRFGDVQITFSFRSDQSIALCPFEEAYFFRQYELDRSYKLSACSSADEFPDTKTYWNMNDLRNIISDPRLLDKH